MEELKREFDAKLSSLKAKFSVELVFKDANDALHWRQNDNYNYKGTATWL